MRRVCVFRPSSKARTRGALNNYINNITDAAAQGEITRMQETANEEVACRIYRVHNFLQTTVNGLRSQHLPHVEQIQNYVSQLSPQLDHSNVAKVANVS